MLKVKRSPILRNPLLWGIKANDSLCGTLISPMHIKSSLFSISRLWSKNNSSNHLLISFPVSGFVKTHSSVLRYSRTSEFKYKHREYRKKYNFSPTDRKKAATTPNGSVYNFKRNLSSQSDSDIKSKCFGTLPHEIKHEKNLFSYYFATAIILSLIACALEALNKGKVLYAETKHELESQLLVLVSTINKNNLPQYINEVNLLLQKLEECDFSHLGKNVQNSIIEGLIQLYKKLMELDVDKAIKICDVAIKLIQDEENKEKLALFYSKKGDAWLSKKEPKEAYEIFMKVIELDNRNANAHYKIGLILLDYDLLEEALQAFNNAYQYVDRNKSVFIEIAKNRANVKSLLSELKTGQDELGAGEASIEGVLYKKVDKAFFESQMEIEKYLQDIMVNEQKNFKETVLHQALRKDEQIAPSLFDNSSIDQYDSAGETPLIIAAKKGDTEAIKNLLALGANPTRRTAYFNYEGIGRLRINSFLPLHYAIEGEHWDAAILLLRKTKHFISKENLAHIIDHYSKSYTGRHFEKNSAIVYRCLTELLTTSFEKASFNQMIASKNILKKYEAHLRWEENIDGGAKLKGMGVGIFLSLRCYFLTVTLFQLNKNLLAEGKLPFDAFLEEKPDDEGYTREEIDKVKVGLKETLVNELHVTLEALYSYRIAEHIANKNRRKPIPKDIINQLKQAYIAAHVDKIRCLAENEEFVFPAGYSEYENKKLGKKETGHSVYAGFFKRQNQLNSSLYNLGPGHERHREDHNQKGYFYPCYLGQIGNDDNFLCDFLDILLTERYFKNTDDNPLDKIYYFKWVKKCEIFQDNNALPTQDVNNCVEVNFDISTRSRLGNLVFAWYIETEASLLSNLRLPRFKPVTTVNTPAHSKSISNPGVTMKN